MYKLKKNSLKVILLAFIILFSFNFKSFAFEVNEHFLFPDHFFLINTNDKNSKIYVLNVSKVFKINSKNNIKLQFNEQYLNNVISDIENDYLITTNDANFFPVLNEKTKRYTLSKTGKKKVNIDKLKKELINRMNRKDDSLIIIPFYEEMEKLVLLSQYKTKYNLNDPGRCYNVRTAGEAFNGIRLKPNERLSFNKIVNPVSYKFKNAFIISNNKFVKGKGGGICQTSTTLFNSALLAGLKINQRRCHSLKVNYVPAGRDATVSTSQDFSFSNNLNEDIYIFYNMPKNDEIEFSIYGSPKDKKNVGLSVNVKNGQYILTRTVNGIVDKFYSRYGTVK